MSLSLKHITFVCAHMHTRMYTHKLTVTQSGLMCITQPLQQMVLQITGLSCVY